MARPRCVHACMSTSNGPPKVRSGNKGPKCAYKLGFVPAKYGTAKYLDWFVYSYVKMICSDDNKRFASKKDLVDVYAMTKDTEGAICLFVLVVGYLCCIYCSLLQMRTN